MKETYFCEYSANDRNGESIIEDIAILTGNNLMELKESIINMTNLIMETYDAYEIIIDVYVLTYGPEQKFFRGRVNRNLPTNIII